MELNSTKRAYPGMFLGYIYEYSTGSSGVYKKDDKIFASISGEIIIDRNHTPPKIEVRNESTEYIPKIGDEVYIRITKVSKNAATGEILSSKIRPIRNPIMGLIKSENVKNDFREFDMWDCFVPGDIVLCKIISIDLTNFIYLSTQDPNHGVIFAWSPITKNIMMPISFQEMICLETKIKERRKVAKPTSI
jgi:exosome complex component CSL4